MTLHFQLGKYSKIKFLNFKLFLGPMADSHRIPQKKNTHNNTYTQTPGLLLLIYERRGLRRYLQTLNQKPSSTCDS